MSQVETGGAKTGGPRVRVKPKPPPKAKAKSTAPPKQADQGDRARSNPVNKPPVKARMYAHPTRPQPQKVIARVVADQDQDQHKRAAVKQTIAHIHVTPVPSPDARDSTRSPAQLARDADIVAKNVRESREKFLRKTHKGAGTRAIKKVAAGGLRTNSATVAPPTMGVPIARRKRGGGAQFGVIRPVGAVRLDRSTAAGKLALNVAPDAAELVVTTPSSVAKLASTAVHDPKKVPGMLAAPYVELAKHPGKSFTERPVTSTLMVAPIARVPGRAVGKVARVAGKQTLERPAASLPGTAAKVSRTGSRDVVVRAVQSHRDKRNPAPTVTVKDVQQHVDHHAEHQRQLAHQKQADAVRDAKRTTPRGTPAREQAVLDARERARDHSHEDAEVAFAEEFGANVRPSTGHAVKSAARTDRAHALEDLTKARGAVRAAAQSELRTARGLLNRQLAKPVAKRQGVAALTVRVNHAQTALRDATAKGLPAPAHDRLVRATTDPAARARLVVLGNTRAAHTTARTAHIAIKRQPVTLVSPAKTGRLFAHKQDAVVVARQLTDRAAQIPRGGKMPVRYAVRDPAAPGLPAAIERAPSTVPVEFTVRQVGDKWAAVPKVANERMHATAGPDAPLSHATVGASKSTVAKVMRTTRGAFTNAVLPLSPKWLGGQATEAGVRAIVSGAGPLDILRFNKTVNELNKRHPGVGDELATRVTGANSTLISGAARDFAQGKSLAEEFRGTPLAQPAAVATKVGRTAPLRAVRAGWRGYTTFVLDRVNGTIENAARKAMAGQAIKNGPLMETRIHGLSDRAIQDAANGLHGTHAQVQLVKAVDRMYGRYSRFSPETRSLILHWTPFLPWTLNAVTFLTKVLPVDHPVLTSVLAATSVATEDWRKGNRLSLRGEGHLPVFMLGSYPDGKGGFRALGRYTPMGITDPAQSAVSLVLPQASSPGLNLLGIGWTGDRLKHPGYDGKEFTMSERIARALMSGAEAQIPGVAQFGRLSGLTPRYIDKKSEIPPLKNRLLKELPGYPMQGPAVDDSGAAAPSGRIKVPGVSGRVKVPGASGRIKVP